jgi:hypothetical protein
MWSRGTGYLGIILLALLSACATSSVDVSRYVRDGVQYGKTEGRFRSRWWNHYERGRSLLEGGFYAEAEKDLRLALAGRDRDQLWPRTYGLHLIPEYFPHRELGIALYNETRIEESIRELELSLKQRHSARGAYYVDLARRQWIRSSNADRETPTVVIESPVNEASVGTDSVEVKGVARDDTYIAAIHVADNRYDIKLSAPLIPFSCPVTLRPGSNEIRVTVTDLAGKTTVGSVAVVVDIDGPGVSFDAPVVFPGTVTGVLSDASSIKRMVIAGKEAALAPQGNGVVAFSCSIEREGSLKPLPYEAEDVYGNRTEGVVPVEVVALSELPDGPIFASSNLTMFPIGSRLTALAVNGEQLLVARVSDDPGALRAELANLHDRQPCYLDEIAVNVSITGQVPVKNVTVNGETLDPIPGRASQRLTRRVRLHEGLNQITAVVEDIEGRKAQDTKNIERTQSDLDVAKGKLGIAFLGNVVRMQSPELAEEAEGILDKLAVASVVNKRFTVVDRSILRELLREQELSQAVASRKAELALCRIIPAEVMFVARVREDQQSTEIILEGTSTETGVRIAPRVDVAGPSGQLDRLIDDLGVRLSQEFPRAKGQVLKGATLPPGQQVSEKEAVGFLSDPATAHDPTLAAEADDVLRQLSSLPAVTDHFTVVDRDLLKNVAAEQFLAKTLAARESRLASSKLVPARVLFSVRLSKTPAEVEITVEGINTQTGASIGSPVSVKGPIADLGRLVEELGRRLVRETPRLAQSGTLRPEGRVTLDLGRTKGVREYLKCLMYRFEEVLDPQTKERLGAKPVVVCEGMITGVSETASTAEVFSWEGQTADEAQTIEAGCHVVTK